VGTGVLRYCVALKELFACVTQRNNKMPRNTIIWYRKDLREKSRELRKKSTVGEELLWKRIRRRAVMGYQFHRQVPMLNFIADFYCHELDLVVEVDGDYHLHPDTQDYDNYRAE
jgi:very-short-patch-repair endonuclease